MRAIARRAHRAVKGRSLNCPTEQPTRSACSVACAAIRRARTRNHGRFGAISLKSWISLKSEEMCSRSLHIRCTPRRAFGETPARPGQSGCKTIPKRPRRACAAEFLCADYRICGLPPQRMGSEREGRTQGLLRLNRPGHPFRALGAGVLNSPQSRARLVFHRSGLLYGHHRLVGAARRCAPDCRYNGVLLFRIRDFRDREGQESPRRAGGCLPFTRRFNIRT